MIQMKVLCPNCKSLLAFTATMSPKIVLTSIVVLFECSECKQGIIFFDGAIRPMDLGLLEFADQEDRVDLLMTPLTEIVAERIDRLLSKPPED